MTVQQIMPNMFEAFNQGRADSLADTERKRQETTRKLFGDALQNKPDALTQLYGVDPATALKAKEQTQTMQKESAQLAWQAASAMHNAAPEQKATTYASIHAEMKKHPELGAWVSQLPDQYDPATVDPIVQGIIAQTGIYQDQPKAGSAPALLQSFDGMASRMGLKPGSPEYQQAARVWANLDPKAKAQIVEGEGGYNVATFGGGNNPTAAPVMTGSAPSPVTSSPVTGGMNIYDAVRQVESGGNDFAVSPKGARGPMQVMPNTSKAPGFGIQPAKNDSVDENLRVGQQYLDAMMTKYRGNQKLALAAYNAGPGAVDAALQKSGGNADMALRYLPQETQQYVPSVLGRVGGGGGSGGTQLRPPPKDAPKADVPSGYRLKADGATLEPIPGGPADKTVTDAPKPMSQKELKAFNTQKAQLPAMERRINEVLNQVDSFSKNLVFDGGPFDGLVASMTEGGQKLDASVGQLKPLLMAFTRVPGIGSQSDLETRMDSLQYPSTSNHPSVNKMLVAELKKFIQDLKAAYDNPATGAASTNPVAPSGPVAPKKIGRFQVEEH